ncbi:MAG: hypothetical protein DWQ34_07680 [Planctomycetota bacterium]|nr:MAG: hypothetical protein DWQ34_07680 [Planctomycetota bacterium]
MDAEFLAGRAEVGRKRLLKYMALWFTVSLGVFVSYLQFVGTDRLPQQIVRFILTVLLFWWLYNGSNVARWLCIVLFWVGGTVMAMLAPGMFRVDTLRGVSTFCDALVMLFFVRTLIWSLEVKLFLAVQRGDRPEMARLSEKLLSE